MLANNLTSSHDIWTHWEKEKFLGFYGHLQVSWDPLSLYYHGRSASSNNVDEQHEKNMTLKELVSLYMTSSTIATNSSSIQEYDVAVDSIAVKRPRYSND